MNVKCRQQGNNCTCRKIPQRVITTLFYCRFLLSYLLIAILSLSVLTTRSVVVSCARIYLTELLLDLPLTYRLIAIKQARRGRIVGVPHPHLLRSCVLFRSPTGGSVIKLYKAQTTPVSCKNII